jgi:hypothetical protein
MSLSRADFLIEISHTVRPVLVVIILVVCF